MINWQAADAKVSALAAEHVQAGHAVRSERKVLREAKQQLTDAREAQSVLQAVAKAVQQTAHSRIAAIVSRCLATVFDSPYRLEIEFVEARGKTEARLKFVRGGLVLDDPLDEASAGMVSVAVFALRLADLVLSRPARRRVLFLDEPFSGLAADLRGRVASMLERLAEELKMQIVLTTHDSDFMVGKVVRL